MSIFDDMSADRGWTPEPPAPIPAAILGVEDTQWLPIVTPTQPEREPHPWFDPAPETRS